MVKNPDAKATPVAATMGTQARAIWVTCRSTGDDAISITLSFQSAFQQSRRKSTLLYEQVPDPGRQSLQMAYGEHLDSLKATGVNVVAVPTWRVVG